MDLAARLQQLEDLIREAKSMPLSSSALLNRDEVLELTPMKRWGTPDDVAAAAVFLASDDARFITGQMIMVNGGVV